MGRHADEVRNRGIAGWLIALVVAVLVVVAATVAYLVVVNRPDSTAGGCTSSAILSIEASPGAAGGMSAAATAFDATAPVARSTCISTAVAQASGPEIVAGLQADWKSRPAPAPTIWAADSGADLSALEQVRADMTAGRDSEPLASSPVVLAVRSADAVAVDGVSWTTLPAAVGAKGSVQLPSGDPLRLALPDPGVNRATADALSSIVASGGAPVTTDRVTAAITVLTALAAGSDLTPDTTAKALTDLSNGDAAFSAVPVMESALGQFNRTAPEPLTAIYPAGPTVVDQVLTTTLTAAWVDATQSEAGAAFHSFLRTPAGSAALVTAGLRVAGTSTPGVPGVDFTHPVTRLADSGPGVPAALGAVLAAAGTGTSTGVSSPPGPATPTTTPPSGTITAPSTSPSSTTSSTTSSTVRSTTATTPTTTRKSTSTSATSTTATSTTASTSTAPGPGADRVITFAIDTSETMSTTVDGRSRIQYAQDGLQTAITGLAGGTVGLWTFSSTVDNGAAQAVSTGPLSAAIGGTPRSQELATAIAALPAGGTRTTYAGIVAAYQAAADSAIAGADNRLILVTDGVDQTPGVSRSRVVSQLQTIQAAGKNVKLIILGVGEAPPVSALTDLATAGGGSYVPVATSPELATALPAAVS